ncbi:MAG: DUF3300 domain-containing protein [Pseudomonadota bacterium]
MFFTRSNRLQNNQKSNISQYQWVALTFFVALVLAGAPISHASDAEISIEPVTLLSEDELRELVAPIALYPDDLLAIVLPASTYPIQIVAAARYREAAENQRSLEPDEDWDESVVALLNYPEALDLLNENIDWTWALGQAVLDQQEDVLSAVTAFRDEAYAAGNLKTDDRQVVEVEDDTLVIKSADPEVVYIPYYEPREVVVYQPRTVYYYYPRSYPVYYYPYRYYHSAYDHHFWGLTSVFALSWSSHNIYHYHHKHRKHRYHGRQYQRRHFFRTDKYHSPRAHQRRIAQRSRLHHGRRHHDNAYWRPNHRYAGTRPNYREHRNREYRRDRHRGYRDDRANNRQHADGKRRWAKPVKDQYAHRDERRNERRENRRRQERRTDGLAIQGGSAIHRRPSREINAVSSRDARVRTPRPPQRIERPNRNRQLNTERNRRQSFANQNRQRNVREAQRTQRQAPARVTQRQQRNAQAGQLRQRQMQAQKQRQLQSRRASPQPRQAQNRRAAPQQRQMQRRAAPQQRQARQERQFRQPQRTAQRKARQAKPASQPRARPNTQPSQPSHPRTRQLRKEGGRSFR